MRIERWEDVSRCLRAGSIVVDSRGVIPSDPFVGVAYCSKRNYRRRITAEMIVNPMIEISDGLRMEIFVRESWLICVVRDERCSGRGAIHLPPATNWDGFLLCLRDAFCEATSYYAVASGRASLRCR